MQITSLTISSDKSKIDLVISDAADVTTLRLWTDQTYKEFSELIDLSSKLTGSITENIEIFPSDLGEAFFDGIYFVESEDNDETSIEFVAELTKYEECILVRSLQLTSCADCLNQKDVIFINMNGLLEVLHYAMNQRNVEVMISIINTLDKYCTEDCTGCGGEVNDVSSYENSNPDTIEIIVDGGSLD